MQTKLSPSSERPLYEQYKARLEALQELPLNFDLERREVGAQAVEAGDHRHAGDAALRRF